MAVIHSKLSEDDCEETCHEIGRLCVQSDGLEVLEDDHADGVQITLVVHLELTIVLITKDVGEGNQVEVSD